MKIRFETNGDRRALRGVIEASMFILAAALVAGSAIHAKERGGAPALVNMERSSLPASIEHIAATIETPASDDASPASAHSAEIRWFNGRPARPIRTVWMTVTAYSPDAQSCGEWADGMTASNKSIWTNGMKLVAADTSFLPFGTMLSIPGYDRGAIVPVLDRGGAIKGDRLDVLFPTHEAALQWGVQRLPVTIWEYADGE